MKQRNKTGNCSSSVRYCPLSRSPLSYFSVSVSDCRSKLCGRAVTDVLYRCFSAWKEEKKKKKKSCLVLHMSALFLELLRSWPHYTDLHTRSPFSVALCASLQVNSRMQMSTFSQGAGWLREAYICVCVCQRVCVCVCVCVCMSPSGRGDERVVTGVLTC